MSTVVENLRKKHNIFTYKNFSYICKDNNLIITFSFSINPDIVFNPLITIKNVADKIKKVDKSFLDNLVFHLGLVEMLSYWKSTCAPEIFIKAGYLNQDQISWWKKLLINGMGEFFYQNKINFTGKDFISIVSSGDKIKKINPAQLDQNKYLTFIGGGKDSTVSLEVLKTLKVNQIVLSLNPTKASLETLKTGKCSDSIIVNRQIDERLLKLNQQGYLNGHTPFSAYLGFLGLISATLTGSANIVVSNERSSDEENITSLGQKINHQYSKSLEFEKIFRIYTAQYINPSFNYFSLVRPLWEIQITKIFSRYPKYFSQFKSCNRRSKQNSWCCQCPKCLSVFILLSPFLGKKTIEIFGKNLYQNLQLAPLLEKLSGLKNPKPFECVGTKEEIKIGLYLSIEQYKDRLPKLLTFAHENILKQEKELEKRTDRIMQSWGYDKFLSPEQKKIMKKIAYA